MKISLAKVNWCGIWYNLSIPRNMCVRVCRSYQAYKVMVINSQNAGKHQMRGTPDNFSIFLDNWNI